MAPSATNAEARRPGDHAARAGGEGVAAYDVVVIGGGASGLAAAIAAARSGARTLVIERDAACGLSILATGNGRCNASNARLDPAHYRHPSAARTVMGAEPERKLAAFFASTGLVTCEIEGRLYPITRRAESVRDCLLAAARAAGVEMRCGAQVTGADGRGGTWRLSTQEPERPISVREHGADFKAELRAARKALKGTHLAARELRARAVILACGGTSAEVAELFGLQHLAEEPVLCPVACAVPQGVSHATWNALDGLRVEAAIELSPVGGVPWREEGEVLFRPYGISGIVAFDLSRRVEAAGRTAFWLDLFPTLGTGDLIGLLRHREDVRGAFDGTDPAWFDGLLARPLAQLVLELLASDYRTPSDGLRGDALTTCARLCHELPLTATGRTELRQAQVRRGGIPIDAVDGDTLRAHIDGHGTQAPLFVCGEALDQDADCGGFNLAWAWASGLCAGGAAARAV